MRTNAVFAAALSALTLCGGATLAHANTFDFTFTQGAYTGADGTITTTDTAGTDGGFTVTGITGEIEGNAIQGLDQPGAELFANDPSMLLNSTGIFVDVPNAFFSSPYNIFYGPEDLGAPVGLVNYQLGTAFGGSLGGSFQVTPVSTSPISAAPEPSTWLLMIAGLGGIGLMLRRAKQSMGFRFKDAFSA